MFSIGGDFLDAPLPDGERIASRSDACWDLKMAEGTNGERMQAKQLPCRRTYYKEVPKIFCTAPQILVNFSRELSHNNQKSLYCRLLLLLLSIFFELQTVRNSCAVILGFHNVLISCHLTVKACQIISESLAARLNKLETSLIYSS